MRAKKIIIVGKGITGCSLAFFLLQQDPNIKITLIGESPEGSATLAAGAMLGCFSEITNKSFSTDAHQEKFNLSYRAKQLWPAWLDQINGHLPSELKLQITAGTHLLLNAKSGEIDNENFENIQYALQRYKEPHCLTSPKNIPGINPESLSRPLKALYIPGEGSLDPNKLLSAFNYIFAQDERITLIDDKVTGLKYTDSAHTAFTHSGKTHTADAISFCAGAETQSFIDQLPSIKERIPRIFSGSGIALLCKTDNVKIKSVIRTPNRSFACGLHVVPRSETEFYVGATNNIGFEKKKHAPLGLTQFLINCLLDQIDTCLHSAEIKKVLVGSRPITLDTFPLIGGTSIPGLWILTGTYRDGFQQSPYLAEILGSQILEGKARQHIFQPERPAITTQSRAEAIDDALLHYLSGGAEHQMHLPRVGWDSLFKEMLEERITGIYKKIGSNFTLPPDFLLMFDEDYDRAMELIKQTYTNLEAAHTEHALTTAA